MTEIVFSLNQIQEVATDILSKLKHRIVLFDAQMGSGKTTLIKEISKQLGVEDMTSSPTFSIVNEYHSTTSKDRVYHFDLYRLNSEEEAYDMGMDEYLDSNHWCFIEWPEKTPHIIPDEHATIEISILENGDRKLILNNN
ncbi:tRNA (adenosine(37)-N6)-threonylcarbamoyltransferase complex ATPase subunit type 1 TsaE [Myroides odoratimimus]|uniref:tRNA (adenosine(37)-N6)-threonylcarbamoyltransferase complex ATPase subunit type 1 TsaE n=1 Tax=Myroides odoratimimus TaxID=76832 RepID=UPI00046942EE|nr:tRNA (adenosine(37)-N6)-threonylcarbamoyltransferase complex ATPase subunit type 1 TsaE [Myroides odoratimimus]